MCYAMLHDVMSPLHCITSRQVRSNLITSHGTAFYLRPEYDYITLDYAISHYTMCLHKHCIPLNPQHTQETKPSLAETAHKKDKACDTFSWLVYGQLEREAGGS